MRFLENKNILLGVTGSIAAYKALELIRLFTKAGANVRVILSEDAKRFVTPLSFEALSKNRVLHSSTESWENDNNHIFINKWADIFVIAPATANTINKLSAGIADNLLTSTALAFTKPILIAPAANTAMFLHKSTQNSLLKLKSFGYKICSVQNKLLACDDKGEGALSEPKAIFFETARVLLSNPFWQDKNIILTGGGTIEKIDDVRFISNFSSGKMAESLATALFLKGANVLYIQSCASHETHLPIKRVFAQSAEEMKKTLNNALLSEKYAFLFMVAAVSDYRVENQSIGKLKKEVLGDKFELKLVKNDDILLNINKKDMKIVGFKAELDAKNAFQNAKNMLKEKNLDAVCLNVIDNANPFGSDTNAITFITKKETIEFLKKSKLEISFDILKNCEEL
ncbi:MAG: bifunctional phosphopantothenoylcysteine decarboxylase/phosphopantothenate--cysteine ligase CoaBC [Campylobacteraceae bacterium]|jgi:phosphopantothenoylcysteine decarboxylase/phosphopantothenate--cysteine ligase|nr:bifunctional phosphopantothenoylcysteine decarboxylase/phosphopantothenate--cysteine ligase CoaBC [Campylobacteraceae bacterium]